MFLHYFRNFLVLLKWKEHALKTHVFFHWKMSWVSLVSLQPLLTAQQLASAVAGVMPGGPPTLNQPILIPFNMAGQLGGQQGLVLTLPTANLTNIQGLVAAAAAGGIMTLPLQNLQGNPLCPCAGSTLLTKPELSEVSKKSALNGKCDSEVLPPWNT
jgi:hypothetical protein